MPEHNMHLWTARLPSDLSTGIHRLRVTSVDRHRRVSEDQLIVEVVDDKPPRFWRTAPWEE
jgi:hypothetical protein